MDNISQQSDEIEALKAIYDDQWVIAKDSESYSIKVSPDVELFITLNSNYPSLSPPNYELLAPSLSKFQKELVSKEFDDIFRENCGGPIIFQWVEKLKELISNKLEVEEIDDLINDEVTEIKKENSQGTNECSLNVVHGSPKTERKSVFQGHACAIKSQEEIKVFMDYLLENKKIAQATHNISAYRIMLPNNVVLQDYDDDGETHAGGRLLHLLQITKATNVMIVVSRWYGGVQLGPDRFKQINNAARKVLLQGGFIKS